MSKQKKRLAALLTALVLFAMMVGMLWYQRRFVLVGLQSYPKNVRQLDLRDREIRARHYEKLRKRLPECEILWKIPLSDGAWSSDVSELTLSKLTETDLQLLDYFPQLETVYGQNCRDYRNLLTLAQRRPEVDVVYSVVLGGDSFAWDAQTVTVQNIAPEEIRLLEYLPELKKVLCSGGDAQTVGELQDYCSAGDLEFGLSLGGEEVSLDARKVTAGGVTDGQLELVHLLPEMKQLHIRNPQASAENLLALRERLPDVKITWERQVCGKLVTTGTEEIDLSGRKVTDLMELDREMEYFPETERVFLGECGLNNDVLAVQRNLVRDAYKLVWTVSCGKKLKTRTDATTFMPVRERVYYFNDEEAYNLRYCEDMVCLDIGHMSIHNIDFVKFMPDLEYLILAHTQLQYIDPISSCKKLKFLELDWSPVRDLTPLKGCTALEDLNLGNTFADFAPVEEMTWLKNLWMIDCSSGARYRMTQALPGTRVMVTGDATVANGWRELDNYYAMRDLLGMYYMSW